jgi:hypothetical protein
LESETPISVETTKEKLHHQGDVLKQKAEQKNDVLTKSKLDDLKSQKEQELKDIEEKYQPTIDLCQQKINKLKSQLQNLGSEDTSNNVRNTVY